MPARAACAKALPDSRGRRALHHSDTHSPPRPKFADPGSRSHAAPGVGQSSPESPAPETAPGRPRMTGKSLGKGFSFLLFFFAIMCFDYFFAFVAGRAN